MIAHGQHLAVAPATTPRNAAIALAAACVVFNDLAFAITPAPVDGGFGPWAGYLAVVAVTCFVAGLVVIAALGRGGLAAVLGARPAARTVLLAVAAGLAWFGVEAMTSGIPATRPDAVAHAARSFTGALMVHAWLGFGCLWAALATRWRCAGTWAAFAVFALLRVTIDAVRSPEPGHFWADLAWAAAFGVWFGGLRLVGGGMATPAVALLTARLAAELTRAVA